MEDDDMMDYAAEDNEGGEPQFLKSLDNRTKLMSYRDRYYTDAGHTRLTHLLNFPDQYYMRHTNGIILFGLTRLHSIFQKEGTSVTKIDFHFNGGDKENCFKGKSKRNAMFVKVGTKVCTVHTSDGAAHDVYTQFKGKCLEHNTEFEKNPNLLMTDPLKSGYLAIFQ